MKSLKAKLIVLLIATFAIAMLIPFNVLAANEGVQLIKTTDGDIVIYVEGLEKTAFDYALSENANAEDKDLNYIKSVQDSNEDEANQVALIMAEDYVETKNDLYIKTEEGVKHIELNFEDMFTQEQMNLVENTTKRISTETVKDLETRTETVNDVKYTYTVGGLKIKDDQNATYSYKMVKLPDAEYTELQNLANELNSTYKEKTMYEKIKFAKDFYNKYNELIEKADWTAVENMEIKQPEDYEKEEQYVVMLKKVAEDGTTTYDAKFMTTFFGEDAEVIPAHTKTVEAQETAKLPITGDSLVLFILLAALVVIAIIVFIRMKKLNKKADK